MLRKIIAFLMCLFSTGLYAQHAPIYSQYIFNGLVLNPAYAGNHEAFSFSLSYRNQWAGMEGTPTTTVLGGHTILKNEKIGLGMLLYQDKIGISRNNGINGNYAYRINTGRVKISMGIQVGGVFVKEDWSEVTTTSTGDDAIPPATSFFKPTLGSGIFINSSKFFFGVSVPQLFSLKRGGEKEGYSYNTFLFTSGVNLPVNDYLQFKPSVLIKYIRNSVLQADFNSLLIYKNLVTGGISYRTNEALVFLMRYAIKDQISFGYSYDQHLGKMGNYVKGSHELLLTYILEYKLKAKGARSF